MSGAGFILAINITVAGLLAIFFMMIAFEKAYVSARWIALAYGLGMANAAFELIIPDFPGNSLPPFLAYVAFLAALVALNIGLAKKYDVPPPWTLLAVGFSVGAAISLSIQDMARDSLIRMLLYQTPYVVLQAVGVLIILRCRKRAWLDNALAGLLGASALHFLAKPFIAIASGGAGSNPESYIHTTYALFSQSLGTVFAVSVALLLLATYVRSMLADARMRSETDALSELFNRRGFEDRAETILNGAARMPVPVSFLICDLDRFKETNDTYGHVAGDRVIALFARILSDAAGAHHIVGRIGGEEFAVILPGADLHTARLVAEGARIAFAEAEIPGLPAGQRFSASFGVAEWQAGERYSDLLRRADNALYEAKNFGRNRVRVAEPAPAKPSAADTRRRPVRSA